MKKKIKYTDIALMLGVSRQLVHKVRYGIIPGNDGASRMIREILEKNRQMNNIDRENKKCC